jgi:phage gpG-like protein
MSLLDGNIDLLYELSRRFRLLGSRRSELVKRVAEEYASCAKARFAAGQDPYGFAYPPLKSRPGKPFVGRSIESEATNPIVSTNSFKVIVTHPYGFVHMLGMTIYPRVKPRLVFRIMGTRIFAKKVRIPKREFVPMTMPPLWDIKITRAIKAWMKELVR